MNKLFQTADGSNSLMSKQFGVSYHSKHGAVQETQHVFINAAFNYISLPKVKLLEIGFGTGLNALMTLQNCRKTNKEVEYVAVEAYPVSMETVESLDYHSILKDNTLEQPLKTMHQLESHVLTEIESNFKFEKRIMLFEDIDESNQYDIIYFDAFAPNAQPELWDVDLLVKMYRALKKGGILTTYCAKGQVKRNLKSLGFTVESIPGPPGKREMTRALKPL
jgi:tRNA U34 5-methylaminomethyl-2-thiouridine-forming methyltransferase MnmC